MACFKTFNLLLCLFFSTRSYVTSSAKTAKISKRASKSAKLKSPSPTLSSLPSFQPSMLPSTTPSMYPSTTPSISDSPTVTQKPTAHPTLSLEPTSANPTRYPSAVPSSQPSMNPTEVPSSDPSYQPSMYPSTTPSISLNPTVTISSTMSGLGSTVTISPTISAGVSLFPTILTFESGRRRRLRGATLLRPNESNIHTILFRYLNETCNDYPHNITMQRLEVTLFVLSELETSFSYIIGSKITSSTESEATWVLGRRNELTQRLIAQFEEDDFQEVKPTNTTVSFGIQDDPQNSFFTDQNLRDSSLSSTRITQGGHKRLIAAVSVAVLSIIAAITIIIARRERIFGERYPMTPNKNSTTTRSPASDFAPVNSSAIRLSFLKLEDDSSLEKSSIADSGSDSSSDVRNMVGVSSLGYDKSSTCGDASIYSECQSYGNMSALDDIRLGSVLQIDGSVADDNSFIERKKSFAQIWGSNRMRMRRTPNNCGRHGRTNSLPSEIRAFPDTRDGACVNPNRKITFHNVCLGSNSQGQSEEESFDDSVLNFSNTQNEFRCSPDASSPFGNKSTSTEVEALDINKLMYGGDEESQEGSNFSVQTPIN